MNISIGLSNHPPTPHSHIAKYDDRTSVLTINYSLKVSFKACCTASTRDLQAL